MKRAYWCVWALVLVPLCCLSVTLGDGMKFPELAVTTMPAIPTQQAIVVYRDGLETLIIESTYETESQTVGWVLPLPAEPTDLAVGDSGMMKSLAWCLQPKVIHDVTRVRNRTVFIAVAVILPLALTAAFSIRPALVLVWWLVSMTAVAIVLPSLGGAGYVSLGGAGHAAGVGALSTQRVGNYEVNILRADDSSSLAEWLAANGLRSLDKKARAITDDYIARKWVFVVAKLRREKDGLATPHPIAATFPADQPVYPMKLTALADTTMHLELYVIADQQASAGGLEPLVADRFQPARMSGSPLPPQPYFRAGRRRHIIGHPDVCELMWPSCVVTRLAGRIAPARMDKDVRIDLAGFTSPYQRRLFSAKARRDIAITCATIACISLMMMLAAMCKGRRKPKRAEICITGVFLLVFTVITGVVYAALPIVPVKAGSYFWQARGVLSNDAKAATLAIDDGNLHADMSDEEFARYPEILRAKEWGGENGITGEDMIFERSPGNFHVRRIDGKVYFCLYDQHAREYRIELARQRRGQ